MKGRQAEIQPPSSGAMDQAERTTPGLFAYTWAALPASPPGAYQWVGRLLQATAGLGAVSLAVSIGTQLPGLLHIPRAFGDAGLLLPVIAAVIVLGWAIAGSYFVSYTYFHWTRGDRRGLLNALWLGLLMVWVGGFGLWARWTVTQDLGGTLRWQEGVTDLLDGLMVLLGVLLLAFRSRPSAKEPFARAAPAPPTAAS
jgi:hypothetical protein